MVDLVRVTEQMLEKQKSDNTAISWMIAIARVYGMRADVLGYQEGCSCRNRDCSMCWALEEVWRRAQQRSDKMQLRYGGLTRTVGGRPQWTGKVRFIEEAIFKALAQKAATAYFPGSRSDIFHEAAKREWIVSFLAAAAIRSDHLFVAPTKRWARASELLADPQMVAEVIRKVHDLCQGTPALEMLAVEVHHRLLVRDGWPLRNFWIGASVGEQQYADEALAHMSTLAAAGWFTWASSEPRRGPIDWTGWENAIKWLVVGGQSGGKSAMPMHPAWPQSDLTWCRANGIPLFLKQLGEWSSSVEKGDPIWVAADGARFSSRLEASDAGYPEKAPPVALMFRCGTKAAGHCLNGGDAYLEIPFINWRHTT